RRGIAAGMSAGSVGNWPRVMSRRAIAGFSPTIARSPKLPTRGARHDRHRRHPRPLAPGQIADRDRCSLSHQLAARAGDHWFSPASACRCAEETGRSPASSFQRRFLPHLGRPGASKRRAGPFYEGGFGAACIAYWPSLRRYALALTRDRDRAEDLVQDTFERALRKRALFRSGTDLCSWLIHML